VHNSSDQSAGPASLVSLYLQFMSLAVLVQATAVVSKLMRLCDAISLRQSRRGVQTYSIPPEQRDNS
jgi:hypothetical protein